MPAGNLQFKSYRNYTVYFTHNLTNSRLLWIEIAPLSVPTHARSFQIIGHSLNCFWLFGIIGLQPIKTRAEWDSSKVLIFETNILRVSPVNFGAETFVR